MAEIRQLANLQSEPDDAEQLATLFLRHRARRVYGAEDSEILSRATEGAGIELEIRLSFTAKDLDDLPGGMTVLAGYAPSPSLLAAAKERGIYTVSLP